MALTNALLKSMGIEGDQRDQIMAAHQETLESIKKERDELRDTAAKVPALEKQIEDMKASQPEDMTEEVEGLKKQLADYKAKVAAEKAEAEKARLYRSMLREQGVDEKRIDSVMKVTDLSKVAVVDGAIADPEAVAKAIAEEWSDFIVRTGTSGAKVENPPAKGSGMTKSEIMEIKDTAARQKAIAENIEQFRN